MKKKVFRERRSELLDAKKQENASNENQDADMQVTEPKQQEDVVKPIKEKPKTNKKGAKHGNNTTNIDN